MCESEDYIPTKASVLRKDAAKNFQTSTFESYKVKKRQDVEHHTSNGDKSTKNPAQPTQINMNKAKHEIIRFGMSGFDTVKKEEAKVQLAIKLGAKPPKNKYINYKQLLEEKKLEKQKMKQSEDLLQLGKNQMGNSTAKGKSFDRKRKKKQGILDVYGQVKVSKK